MTLKKSLPQITCKVDGCDRHATYREQQVCQKHYFRFMRNGHYGFKGFRESLGEKPRCRVQRKTNAKGYILIDAPGHPLSMSDEYVYEHRKVVYDRYGDSLPPCEICGKPTNWKTCHIDHKDEDITNNDVENLRPLCRPCNTFRGKQTPYAERKRCTPIEYEGEVKTSADWARDPRVSIPAHTIRNRYNRGLPVHDCLFMPKLTHNGKKAISANGLPAAAK